MKRHPRPGGPPLPSGFPKWHLAIGCATIVAGILLFAGCAGDSTHAGFLEPYIFGDKEAAFVEDFSDVSVLWSAQSVDSARVANNLLRLVRSEDDSLFHGAFHPFNAGERVDLEVSVRGTRCQGECSWALGYYGPTGSTVYGLMSADGTLAVLQEMSDGELVELVHPFADAAADTALDAWNRLKLSKRADVLSFLVNGKALVQVRERSEVDARGLCLMVRGDVSAEFDDVRASIPR